jgi:hypothetical protein
MTQLLSIVFILFLAGLMRSTFGFGDALLAMPLLLIILDLPTATPLVALAAFTLALVMLSADWREVDARGILPFILTTALGIPLGVLLLRQVESRWLLTGLGVLLVGFGLYRLSRPHMPEVRHPAVTLGLGLLGGLLGGAYNTQGPPVVLYGSLRGWTPAAFRASVQAYFLVTYALIAASHAVGALWTGRVLWLYVLSLPALVASVWVGRLLAQRLDARRFDRFLSLALIVLGAMLIFRQ